MFFGPSWRTGMLGAGAILVALGLLGTTIKAQFDGDPVTVPDWEATFVALSSALAGVGLLNARDNKVSSEEVKKSEEASK